MLICIYNKSEIKRKERKTMKKFIMTTTSYSYDSKSFYEDKKGYNFMRFFKAFSVDKL